MGKKSGYLVVGVAFITLAVVVLLAGVFLS